MATNYTTKTAALKATLADIRQVAVGKKIEVGSGETTTQITKDSVSAEDLLISVDGKDERQSVKTLIQQAQKDATNAAGIQVGTETDKVTSADANNDGLLDGGIQTKVKGMNFCGNVAVVNNADGTVDFWFMNPDNPEKPSSMTESSAPGTSMYVYSGSGDTDGLTLNGTHARCTKDNAGTPTYTLKGTGKKAETSSTTMSAPNTKSTIKVTITDGDGTLIKTVTSPAICIANTATKARGGTITHTEGGVTITLSNVIENIVDNKNNDAQDGYTPGYVRFSGSVKVTTSSILGTNGGTYKVNIKFNDGTSDTDLGTSGVIYSYKTNTLTAADAPTASWKYSTNTEKRVTISGITYDNDTCKMTLDVQGIKGTQRGGAHNKAQTARAYLNWQSGVTSGKAAQGAADFSLDKQAIATAYASGTKTGSDAVLSGSISDNLAVTGNPVKPSVTRTGLVQVYEQNGSTLSTAAQCVPTIDSSVTNGGWIYTGAASTTEKSSLTDSANVSVTFTRDNARVLADYDSLKAGTAPVTFDSTKLLSDTAYMKQLLVQGGTLRQTKKDATGTYTNITGDGKRCYVTPFTANYTGSVIYATVGGMTAFSTDKIRIYLVCKKSNGTVGAQMLNNYNANNTSSVATYGANAIAQDTAPSSNRWKCEIVKGTFALNEAGATYWLVVEMENDCTVQPTSITISAK